MSMPEQTIGNNIILFSWFGGKSLHCVCLLLGKRVQLEKLDILTASFQEKRSDKVSIASSHGFQPPTKPVYKSLYSYHGL